MRHLFVANDAMEKAVSNSTTVNDFEECIAHKNINSSAQMEKCTFTCRIKTSYNK